MTSDQSGPETTLTGEGRLATGTDQQDHSLSDVGERAKELGREKAQDMKAGLESARDAATDRAEKTIDRAAEDVSRTASALDDAANRMEDGGTPQNLLREAAHGLTRLSETMRGSSLSDLVGELSEFGRRNPPAFLGVAAAAGFALARFGVASGRGQADPSSGPYAPDPTGGPRHG